MRTSINFLLGLALWATIALMCLMPAAHAAPAASTNADAEDGPGNDYWQEGNRGWFFYERKPKKPAPPPETVVVAPPVATSPAIPAEPPKPPKHPDLVRFEALQKRVEDSRNIAIINPTEENLRNFLAAQSEALDTAGKFGELTKRVLWANPQFDPTVTGGRPTSATGLSLYEAEDERRQKRNWRELSETHAFFYFFRSDCPYCARFSPILKAFSQRTGIEIFPISMDGQGTAAFPKFRPDNGMAARLNVTQVPALFLAEPRAGKVMPVGYGVISPTDLEHRLDLITRPDVEMATPSTTKYVGELARR